MSFDSFKSSTLGPEALEARKKLEEQRKKEVEARRARNRAAEAKRAEWAAFQAEIGGEYDKPLEGPPGEIRGAAAPRLNRNGDRFSFTTSASAPPSNANPQPSVGRLKRF